MARPQLAWGLVLAVLLMGTAAGCGPDTSLAGRIYDQVETAADRTNIDLTPAFGTGWRAAFLFDGEPSAQVVEQFVGRRVEDYEPSMGDGTTVIVLKDDGQLVWSYLPSANGAVSGEYVEIELPDGPIRVDPGAATFTAATFASGTPVALCLASQCP